MTAADPRKPGSDETTAEVFRFPCSVAQQTNWYLDQLQPGNPSSNIAVRFRLDGRVDARRLHEALTRVVERHEVLRTRFVAVDGEPWQQVEPRAAVPFYIVDLRPLPDSDRAAEADRLAAEEARRGFDLATGPLIRAQLLQLDDEEFVLLLSMHHIISDGWSVGIVTEELGVFYEAAVQGRAASLPPLPLQYADYACWQQEQVANGTMETQLQFWEQLLDGYTPLHIPVDTNRPSPPTNRGHIRSLVLPRELTTPLEAFAQQRGATLFMAALAALLVVLQRLSGQNDLVLRTQTGGRGQAELESLVGWFANTIPLRFRLEDHQTYGELLDATRDHVLAAFANQDAPFEHIVKRARPKVEIPRHPPFQVNFIFHRDFVRIWNKAGVRLAAIPSKSVGTFVDLNFFLVERKDGWRASVDVNTDVFHLETGDLLLANFVRVLEAIQAGPQTAITAIPQNPRPQRHLSSPAVEAAPSAAPARSNREAQVIAIWERFLNASPIGVHSNFFDLGGHSLIAAAMLAEFQKVFHKEIQLRQLFADPTPAAMARILESTVPHSGPLLIDVQPEGSRPPFFMIDGDHWYRPVALELGRDQPFVGVQLAEYRHLDLAQHRPRIAAEVAARLLDAHPDGYFLLGGWCAAGITAYEVARALQARHAQVGLLVLFDAVHPDYFRSLRGVASSTGKALSSARSVLQASLRGEFLDSLRSLSGLARRAYRRLEYVVNSRYTCPQVPFPILLIRPPSGGVADPEMGWGGVSPGQLSVEEIPGNHTSLFRDPALTASILRRHLDRALARRTGA